VNSIKEFGETAKGLARNPLGIIALFIVLIYGFAALIVGVSGQLAGGERLPLIWFLVLFPVLVLTVFAWLVSAHHTKLYAPSDYQRDEAFLQAAKKEAEVATALSTTVAKQLTSETPVQRRPQVKTILWVDDRPENNTLERHALESLGLRFVLSTSTEDALERVKTAAFDAIISDMGRPPDPRAGYTLLNRLRAAQHEVPFIIYAGSRAPQHVAEAKRHGALGATDSPQELFDMVLAATGWGVASGTNNA
jgi:CheY-like chemotaxis protein